MMFPKNPTGRKLLGDAALSMNLPTIVFIFLPIIPSDVSRWVTVPISVAALSLFAWLFLRYSAALAKLEDNQ